MAQFQGEGGPKEDQKEDQVTATKFDKDGQFG